MTFEYFVIRSQRRSISISIKDNLVIVRAPNGAENDVIARILKKHERWIEKHLQKTEEKRSRTPELSESEINAMKRSASEYFPPLVDKFSSLMGLKCSRIRITSAEHRYGSCNSKGNICFSYRLMLYPEAAREYVVVHELAHLKEMNHSPAFYKIIEKYMPDYRERKKLLD